MIRELSGAKVMDVTSGGVNIVLRSDLIKDTITSLTPATPITHGGTWG